MMYQTVADTAAGRWSEGRQGEAQRLFHGRGHCYPGWEHLTVTWYPPYLILASYRKDGEDLEPLAHALKEAIPPVEGIVIQDRDGRRTSSRVVAGPVPDEHLVTENGLRYWIQPLRNQNVGLFLDMGHVRQYLSGHVRNRSVLNLFAYTCAFSVSAIEHGAKLVVNNDMSRNALQTGTRNHEANGHDLRKVRMLPHNLFKSWWKIRQLGPFDVVIIDPPTNQRGSFVAEKSYGQVLKRIPEFTARGGRVIACLNSPFLGPDFLLNQMQRWCPDCHHVQTLLPHPDFPEMYPERGLKVLEFRYR